MLDVDELDEDELDVDDELDFEVLELEDDEEPLFVLAVAVSSAKKVSIASSIAPKLSHEVNAKAITAAAKKPNIFLFLFMLYFPLVKITFKQH